MSGYIPIEEFTEMQYLSITKGAFIGAISLVCLKKQRVFFSLKQGWQLIGVEGERFGSEN